MSEPEQRSGEDRRKVIDLTRAERGLPERRDPLRERRRRYDERRPPTGPPAGTQGGDEAGDEAGDDQPGG